MDTLQFLPLLDRSSNSILRISLPISIAVASAFRAQDWAPPIVCRSIVPIRKRLRGTITRCVAEVTGNRNGRAIACSIAGVVRGKIGILRGCDSYWSNAFKLILD